jgi:hypothetical protein
MVTVVAGADGFLDLQKQATLERKVCEYGFANEKVRDG